MLYRPDCKKRLSKQPKRLPALRWVDGDTLPSLLAVQKGDYVTIGNTSLIVQDVDYVAIECWFRAGHC
ncbi:hypothetical protein EON65_00410 [archaeon]|nr:MAG: hypothetical protein EON65_00410 [archaeon]